ncbi:S-layer family protein [Ciceribacter sp. RN22]|uniref:beta strand repeat-containing protein n=1 Tax=Ciceribacter sp. RN22 TaxID=2954932 RepID=UPI002093C0BD|nr:GLUG motif-containing protein [Ciceribacter sp. RN22]MCO6179820.1 filamentous hemagglutinin N-terminal domain-containing protein [Ciceribacter sp. RN22]
MYCHENVCDFAKHKARLAGALLASTALAVNPLAAFAGDVLPTGGTVAAGSVNASTSGTTMTVTQSSDQAIVNWNGFSIGQGYTVNFVQPDSSSAILNRVTGSTTSTIAGSLTANGQVYLINPNGIAITSTGSVKVGGGFVASTLDISDEDFLNGNLKFQGDGASAGVSNEGVITIGRGGYAALLGGTVKNSGTIAVPVGKVGLGSGEQATLDLSGDGFLQVAVPTADGAEGDGALVENSGSISASGGLVVMKAATAKSAARQAINMSGVVEADSVSGSDGEIVIGGGDGGTVKVSGKVTAKSSTGKGGKIKVTGKTIKLASAEIDASGATGGGSINIGGLRHGADGLQTAETTSVDANTVIRADATQAGNGGNVVVWSDLLTTYNGTISAVGAGTGTGGDAEVSGKATLVYTGYTNLYGPGGYGTLLLDPYNITISSGTASNSSGTTATGNDSVINVSTLTNALASANVEITTNSGGSQTGNITVASDISWSAGTTLTLTAANNIYVNANITATGASAGLVLTYGGSDYSIASGSSITLSGASASLAINGQAYTLIHSMSELDAIDTTGLSGHYALAEDLDASGTTYTSALVATGSSSFTGTFAGLGNTISNLTINASSGYGVALFYGSSGAIRDVGLASVNITGGYYVGALVGSNRGTISNSYATGSVNGTYSYIGGLVGQNSSGGAISNSYATVGVGGSTYVGGLVGLNDAGAISNSYAAGSVTGVAYVGGLAGDNGSGYGSGTIANSYATGSVTGDGDVGGLVGYNVNSGSISYSYATGSVTGGSSSGAVGGLVGTSYGTISNSYATGNVLGFSIGGLVGHNRGAISNSYATGSVTGSGNYIGGLVGYNNSGTISYSYATGAVTASSSSSYSYAGGLLGYSTSGTVSYSYATGAVNAAASSFYSYAGGLIGYNANGTVSYSYATGAVNASSLSESSSSAAFAGGLVGYSDNSTISYSYATGAVNASSASFSFPSSAYVGGLVGYDFVSTISYSYAAGAVTASASSSVANNTGVGGLLGYTWLDGSTFTALYWDTESSGTTTGVGLGTATGVTGLTSAQARVASNYSGWDFSTVWYQTGDMRPILRSEAATAVNGVITVSNLHQLALMGADLTASYQLTADLDASATASTATSRGIWGAAGWQSVGDFFTAFSGTFDGNGHTISNLTISASSATFVGLFGGSEGTITNIGLVNADITGGSYVGGLIGINAGTVSNAYVTGSVSGSGDYVGGLVGYGGGPGTVSTSNSTASVSGGAGVGGLMGSNRGGISNSYSTGSVTGTSYVGGLVGYGDGGTVSNSYATGSVSGTSYVGGLMGFSTGTIRYSYATGSVNGSGDYVGGLVGGNAGTLTALYWDTVTSGRTTGVGVGSATGVTGLTTSQFQDTDYFYTLASAAGWDFETVWAPPSDGYYPELYAMSTVAWVSDVAASSTYGDSTATVGSVTSHGGPSSYVWGRAGDSLTLTGGTYAVSSTTSAGSHSSSLTTSVSSATSADGLSYRVIYYGGTNNLTVAQRAITVAANAASSTYGNTASLTYSVTSGSLVNGDSLSGSLASTGASSTANVGDYSITQGTLDNSNYAITYVGNTLTVGQRAITVAANAASSTYGETASLTYSVTSGSLVNGDRLSGSLASTGASSTANVGTYSITQGTLAANSNYAVTYVAGTLTVGQRAITVTADNVTITDGDTANLTWRLTSGSLVNGDSLSGSLASDGTSGGVGTYSITQGTLAAGGNYALTYAAGILTVNAASGGGGTTIVPSTPLAGTFGQSSSPFGFSGAGSTGLGGTSGVAQIVSYGVGSQGSADQSSGSGSSGSVMTVEDPELSGAVCQLGDGSAVACSVN